MRTHTHTHTQMHASIPEERKRVRQMCHARSQSTEGRTRDGEDTKAAGAAVSSRATLGSIVDAVVAALEVHVRARSVSTLVMSYAGHLDAALSQQGLSQPQRAALDLLLGRLRTGRKIDFFHVVPHVTGPGAGLVWQMVQEGWAADRRMMSPFADTTDFRPEWLEHSRHTGFSPSWAVPPPIAVYREDDCRRHFPSFGGDVRKEMRQIRSDFCDLLSAPINMYPPHGIVLDLPSEPLQDLLAHRTERVRSARQPARAPGANDVLAGHGRVHGRQQFEAHCASVLVAQLLVDGRVLPHVRTYVAVAGARAFGRHGSGTTLFPLLSRFSCVYVCVCVCVCLSQQTARGSCEQKFLPRSPATRVP